MNRSDGQIITSCIKFAARFGFLTRDLFFAYLCPGSRANQYRKWNLLLEERWFTPSGSDPLIVYLSSRAKKIFSLKEVKARSPLFIHHDSLVAEILLSLEKTNLVIGTWTEAELSRQRWDVFSILGSDRIGKIPDLVVDLKTTGENLRIAIEVEVSRKSRTRYSHIALSYLEMKRVDLIMYACSREQIITEIKRAFRGETFAAAQKQPGTFLLQAFQKAKFETPFNYLNTNYSIKSFLEAATKLQLSSDQTAERSETIVSEIEKTA